MDHDWLEGPEVYCGNVGWSTFEHCQRCGLMRVHGDRYAILSGHSPQFSMDCQVAQEQVKFYLLGLLHDPRWPHDSKAPRRLRRYGGVIEKALRDNTATLTNALRAVRILEKGEAEDIELALQGGPPPPGEPLDVELDESPDIPAV